MEQHTPTPPSTLKPDPQIPVEQSLPAPKKEDSIYSRAEASERMLFKPPIDIYESEGGLVLLADLPGVTLDTLELQVQNNKLTLFGRVKKPVGDDAELRHCEYHEGDYLRSFILSDEVDYDRIKATLNNGVLKVVLPKAQKAEPRRIEVQTD
jgi:HSP20 family molecular chaperone IbpA